MLETTVSCPDRDQPGPHRFRKMSKDDPDAPPPGKITKICQYCYLTETYPDSRCPHPAIWVVYRIVGKYGKPGQVRGTVIEYYTKRVCGTHKNALVHEYGRGKSRVERITVSDVRSE